MQDELATRGAWGNSRSIRNLMLLGAALFCMGAMDRGAQAQETPAAEPTSPITQAAPTPPPPANAPSTAPATTTAPDTPTAADAAPGPAADTPSSPAATTAPSGATTEPAASQPTGPSTASPVSPSTIPTVEATTVEEAPTEFAGEGDAPETAAEATTSEDQAPATGGAHDLSPWGMYQAADIVVKGVMIGLVFACFVTWTVWLAKTIEIAAAKARLRSGIQRISSAESLTHALQAFEGIRGPASRLVHEAAEEVTRSSRLLDTAGDQGVKERVTSRLSRVEAAAQRRMTLGTGVLATIGSTSPFVGLFGTVWGIMNSFIGIAESQTTNLAVVAPGIAEALLATGIGLVAAIPAVIIYNAFARSIAGYKLLLADAAAGVERLVSHELDLRKLWQASKPARQAAAAE